MPRRPRKIEGRAHVKLRRPSFDWPDPPMVPTVALRRCEQACTIEEVRAIVAQFLPPRKPPCQETDSADHG